MDPDRHPEPGSAGSMAACPPGIVHGEIFHARTRPRRHAFRYRAFCLRLPLSRLDELPAAGIARNRAGVISFHERDHGPRDGSPLLPWIRALLATEGIVADGEVVLHAFPRMLGFVFNPVAFWVCHDRGGVARAILCEVSNTFGEHHNYLLANPDRSALVTGQTLHAHKCFHVSPFCEVKGTYAFRFSLRPDAWLARIDYSDTPGQPVPLLHTRIAGRVVPLGAGVARALPWRFPLFTFGVVLHIHWQALRLWLGGVRFFSKPPPPAQLTSR